MSALWSPHGKVISTWLPGAWMKGSFLFHLAILGFLKEGCEPDKKKTLKDPYKESQIREGKRNSSQWRISCESTTFTSSPRKGGDDAQQTPLKLESGISTPPSGLQGQPCSNLMFAIWRLQPLSAPLSRIVDRTLELKMSSRGLQVPPLVIR